MSEYFRILNRVEAEHADSDLNAGSKPLTRNAPGAPSRSAHRRNGTSHRPATEHVAAVPAPLGTADATVPSASLPARDTESFARAFDNLRAIAADCRLRSVVIAAASRAETVQPVVAGLAAEACKHQLQTLTAAFAETAGEYVLRERSLYAVDADPAQASDEDAAESIRFHLGTSDLPGLLTAWLDHARQRHDLLLLHGPALGKSVDAALIARATDGLVIVVEPGVTGQQELRSAVERARSVGCRILGLVAAGAREELPAWMRQLVG